jgi:hypothetical protein
MHFEWKEIGEVTALTRRDVIALGVLASAARITDISAATASRQIKVRSEGE